MKKLLAITAIVLFLLIPFYASAAETTLTFAWDEPTDIELITVWKILWSETSDGFFAEIATIPKNDTFQGSATVDVIGEQGTTETRFFVLVACGFLEGVYACSGKSNEISYDFEIPPDSIKVPVNFRIIEE